MALALLIATVMVGGLAAIWVDRGEAEVHAQSLGVNLASTLAVQHGGSVGVATVTLS